GGNRVGILVDGQHARDPEPCERDREDPRARSEVQRPARGGEADGALDRFQTARGAAVVPGAERPARLDHEYDPIRRVRGLPGGGHDEALPDDDRSEVLTPCVGPARVFERRDAWTTDRAEAEGGEPVRVGGHALAEDGGRSRLWKEGAELRSLARSLLFDHAERAALPEEVGEAFGRGGWNGEGQLPITGGWTHRYSRSFLTRSMNEESSGPRWPLEAVSNASRASRCLALSFWGTSRTRRQQASPLPRPRRCGMPLPRRRRISSGWVPAGTFRPSF